MKNQNSKKIQNYINNIAMVIDASSSMTYLKESVIKVFDNQVAHLCERSKSSGQETRISVYLFADKTECICTDMDVLRVPSLKDIYEPYGNTALIDATIQTINDLKEIPQKYVDRAFMIYVISDGQNNRGSERASQLKSLIESLPENFTVAYFAPDQNAAFEAKKYGFPANNISQWTTDAKGVSEMGETLRKVTDNYFVSRSAGVRGTKNLFQLKTDKLNQKTIVNNLEELKPSKDYECIPVRKKEEIKTYVESYLKQPYRIGSAYYEFMKKEKIQPSKQICIKNKLNAKVYSGLAARQLLGLPSDLEVRVNPSDFGEWRIFVQSSSVNRHLVPGTELIILN